MRGRILRSLYTLFPFPLDGDCTVSDASDNIRISCVINFYGRLDVLRGILYSLSAQIYPSDSFEVVLVEDRGGTDAGRKMADIFSDRLHIVYSPIKENFGRMGYSRNHGFASSRGEIILFLDDDTVILQDDFLDILDKSFNENLQADAIVPNGHAAYSCIEDRYDYHDPYFMTSRCTAYRRAVLSELSGFIDAFVGQEDVEFVTRFTIAGKVSLNSPNLHYYHPPMLTPNTRKPRSVGYSFYGLKCRYSFPIWILLLLNCARHAPLLFLSKRRYKEQGRFGVGFVLGIFDGITGKKGQVYG